MKQFLNSKIQKKKYDFNMKKSNKKSLVYRGVFSFSLGRFRSYFIPEATVES